MENECWSFSSWEIIYMFVCWYVCTIGINSIDIDWLNAKMVNNFRWGVTRSQGIRLTMTLNVDWQFDSRVAGSPWSCWGWSSWWSEKGVAIASRVKHEMNWEWLLGENEKNCPRNIHRVYICMYVCIIIKLYKVFYQHSIITPLVLLVARERSILPY